MSSYYIYIYIWYTVLQMEPNQLPRPNPSIYAECMELHLSQYNIRKKRVKDPQKVYLQRGFLKTKFTINSLLCITHTCKCPQFVIFVLLNKSHFDVISPQILTQSFSKYPSMFELDISDERHAWSSSDRCIRKIIKGSSRRLIIKIKISVSVNLMTIWLEGYMIIWCRLCLP